jgi:formamidopyrimidine-DNA glycosylase
MPELPDILLYLHALRPRVVGQPITRLRVVSPFVLRTFEPPVEDIEGREVTAVSRLGKRIVFEVRDDLFVVVHLMIAGRLRWTDKVGVKGPGKINLASFEFPVGTLHLVEPSQKKRAGIWLIKGRDALASLAPGGLDVVTASTPDFAAQLRSENHTLKRAITDPRLFDGIGNAYSDEILHAAGLSPLALTSKLTDEQIQTLHAAARNLLNHWAAKLQSEFKTKFPGPGDVTAFRPDFAAHGKFGQPCPTCGTQIMRIRYAENETDYCPRCQTQGKVLADRSMSILLKKDWPNRIEDWE